MDTGERRVEAIFMKFTQVAGCVLIFLPLAVRQSSPNLAVGQSSPTAASTAAAAEQQRPVGRGVDADSPDSRAGGTAAPARQSASVLEVLGRTHCMLSRRGIVAAAILRPVVEVLVKPGDRVTKGQPLVKLYDLEPKAKLRAREQELKNIQAKALYSQRNLELADNSRGVGAVPQRSLNDLRATALSNQALVLAAEAELAHAQAELKLYTVTASIDGEIAWLDVSPGTVSWPGAMMWGEIVDLRELDVRCDLPPLLAEQVAVGQPAEVALERKAEPAGTGKVVFIGKSAEHTSGLVPVWVRMVNPEERLRAEVAVKVRIQTQIGK
jgi:membrane fusion protein (multidrug efflux system)